MQLYLYHTSKLDANSLLAAAWQIYWRLTYATVNIQNKTGCHLYLKTLFHEIVRGRKDYENLRPMTIGINTNKYQQSRSFF